MILNINNEPTTATTASDINNVSKIILHAIKDIFNIYIFGFAYMNKVGNRSIFRLELLSVPLLSSHLNLGVIGDDHVQVGDDGDHGQIDGADRNHFHLASVVDRPPEKQALAFGLHAEAVGNRRDCDDKAPQHVCPCSAKQQRS